jgi:HEPN domain-containing protein
LIAETRVWLRFAHEDLATALALSMIETTPPRHICYLAQQAAEKVVKAALVRLQTDFPKSHNLVLLVDLLPEDWSVTSTGNTLAKLSTWAVEARYPGDWEEPDPADAQESLIQAEEVFESIRREFTQRKLGPDWAQ